MSGHGDTAGPVSLKTDPRNILLKTMSQFKCFETPAGVLQTERILTVQNFSHN